MLWLVLVTHRWSRMRHLLLGTFPSALSMCTMGKPFFWSYKEEDEKANALPQACCSLSPDLEVEIASSRYALRPPHIQPSHFRRAAHLVLGQKLLEFISSSYLLLTQFFEDSKVVPHIEILLLYRYHIPSRHFGSW